MDVESRRNDSIMKRKAYFFTCRGQSGRADGLQLLLLSKLERFLARQN